MKRVLLLALLGIAVTGCAEPSRTEVPIASESAAPPPQPIPASAQPADTTAAAPPQGAPEPKATATATAAATAAVAAKATAQPSTGTDGRLAKPGWCQKDSDCPGGQVCEQCEGGKCCAPGCHSDAQCPAGHRCKPVVCMRAPCPSMCEAGGGPATKGGSGPAPSPPSKGAPEK